MCTYDPFFHPLKSRKTEKENEEEVNSLFLRTLKETVVPSLLR